MTTVMVTPTDDRVETRSAAAKFLGRPEVGALIGASAVALLFFSVAPAFRHVANIGTILYGSSTIGIMAVAVALLMIGGEFDLSAGVAVTSSGLAAAHTAWYLGLNVWSGVAFALVFSLAIGAFNGWLLHRTGLPSFLVTLGSFFVLQGVNLAIPGSSPAASRRTRSTTWTDSTAPRRCSPPASASVRSPSRSRCSTG
jgi:simple sugar transport system permease protein